MALIDIETKQDLIKLKRDLRKQFAQEKFKNKIYMMMLKKYICL